jgi:benzoylformate decarboxylase
MLEDIVGAPGLDLPALDCAAVARGYGVDSHVASDADELSGALTRALASGKPELVEVKVAPGMALA